MKKVWKILGAAALIGLIPYSFYNKNEATGETTTYALLWKLTTRPDTENPGKREITLDLGFHKPADPDAHLYEDDACWCSSSPADGSVDPNESIPF